MLISGITYSGKSTSAYTYEYDAWGKPISTYYVASPYYDVMYYNPLRYRGYIYDNETGFYYLQSRYYDPVVGRFINADILVSTGQGFTGFNMFAYCGNNPVSRKDVDSDTEIEKGFVISVNTGLVSLVAVGICMFAQTGDATYLEKAWHECCA